MNQNVRKMEKAILKLKHIVDKAPSILTQIGEQEMSAKPFPNKWSKKQILGHLVDSATNNHQRFVRGQFEENPEIGYDQNKWNEFGFYQEIDNQQIIHFWTIYNRQILEIITRISKENLQNQIKIGEKLYSLEFLIVDYVEHLEHHLNQVINY
ncbi:MAG: DinB family protein [Flavobacteriaceae bacterium]|nr:MAG: DinB family protein [Flavobacteriaceae bacterium]